MSRGQKPRQPSYFPHMKRRGKFRAHHRTLPWILGSLRNQPWVIYRDSDYSPISKETR